MNAASIKACCRVAAILSVLVLSACNQAQLPSSSVSEVEALSSISSPIAQVEQQSQPADVPPSSEIAAVLEPIPAPPAPAVATSVSQQPVSLVGTETSAIPLLADIAALYARNFADYTYVGEWVDFARSQDSLTDFDRGIRERLSVFQGLTPTDETLQISDCEFLIWTKDGVRHTFGMVQDRLVADGKAYLLPQERAKDIRLFHQYILDLGKTASYMHIYPQWLVWMTHSNIQEVIFHSPTRGPLTITPVLADYVADNATRAVQPTGASTYQLESVDFSGNDVFHLEIRFKTDVVYHIYAKNAGYGGYEADYYVQSSDMSFGCKYRTKLSSIYGAAQFLIDEYEHIADAKSIKDLLNPST